MGGACLPSRVLHCIFFRQKELPYSIIFNKYVCKNIRKSRPWPIVITSRVNVDVAKTILSLGQWSTRNRFLVRNGIESNIFSPSERDTELEHEGFWAGNGIGFGKPLLDGIGFQLVLWSRILLKKISQQISSRNCRYTTIIYKRLCAVSEFSVYSKGSSLWIASF